MSRNQETHPENEEPEEEPIEETTYQLKKSVSLCNAEQEQAKEMLNLFSTLYLFRICVYYLGRSVNFRKEDPWHLFRSQLRSAKNKKRVYKLLDQRSSSGSLLYGWQRIFYQCVLQWKDEELINQVSLFLQCELMYHLMGSMIQMKCMKGGKAQSYFAIAPSVYVAHWFLDQFVRHPLCPSKIRAVCITPLTTCSLFTLIRNGSHLPSFLGLDACRLAYWATVVPLWRDICSDRQKREKFKRVKQTEYLQQFEMNVPEEFEYYYNYSESQKDHQTMKQERMNKIYSITEEMERKKSDYFCMLSYLYQNVHLFGSSVFYQIALFTMDGGNKHLLGDVRNGNNNDNTNNHHGNNNNNMIGGNANSHSQAHDHVNTIIDNLNNNINDILSCIQNSTNQRAEINSNLNGVIHISNENIGNINDTNRNHNIPSIPVDEPMLNELGETLNIHNAINPMFHSNVNVSHEKNEKIETIDKKGTSHLSYFDILENKDQKKVFNTMKTNAALLIHYFACAVHSIKKFDVYNELNVPSECVHSGFMKYCLYLSVSQHVATLYSKFQRRNRDALEENSEESVPILCNLQTIKEEDQECLSDTPIDVGSEPLKNQNTGIEEFFQKFNQTKIVQKKKLRNKCRESYEGHFPELFVDHVLKIPKKVSTKVIVDVGKEIHQVSSHNTEAVKFEMKDLFYLQKGQSRNHINTVSSIQANAEETIQKNNNPIGANHNDMMVGSTKDRNETDRIIRGKTPSDIKKRTSIVFSGDANFKYLLDEIKLAKSPEFVILEMNHFEHQNIPLDQIKTIPVGSQIRLNNVFDMTSPCSAIANTKLFSNSNDASFSLALSMGAFNFRNLYESFVNSVEIHVGLIYIEDQVYRQMNSYKNETKESSNEPKEENESNENKEIHKTKTKKEKQDTNKKLVLTSLKFHKNFYNGQDTNKRPSFTEMMNGVNQVRLATQLGSNRENYTDGTNSSYGKNKTERELKEKTEKTLKTKSNFSFIRKKLEVKAENQEMKIKRNSYNLRNKNSKGLEKATRENRNHITADILKKREIQSRMESPSEPEWAEPYTNRYNEGQEYIIDNNIRQNITHQDNNNNDISDHPLYSVITLNIVNGIVNTTGIFQDGGRIEMKPLVMNDMRKYMKLSVRIIGKRILWLSDDNVCLMSYEFPSAMKEFIPFVRIIPPGTTLEKNKPDSNINNSVTTKNNNASLFISILNSKQNEFISTLGNVYFKFENIHQLKLQEKKGIPGKWQKNLWKNKCFLLPDIKRTQITTMLEEIMPTKNLPTVIPTEFNELLIKYHSNTTTATTNNGSFISSAKEESHMFSKFIYFMPNYQIRSEALDLTLLYYTNNLEGIHWKYVTKDQICKVRSIPVKYYYGILNSLNEYIEQTTPRGKTNAYETVSSLDEWGNGLEIISGNFVKADETSRGVSLSNAKHVWKIMNEENKGKTKTNLTNTSSGTTIPFKYCAKMYEMIAKKSETSDANGTSGKEGQSVGTRKSGYYPVDISKEKGPKTSQGNSHLMHEETTSAKNKVSYTSYYQEVINEGSAESFIPISGNMLYHNNIQTEGILNHNTDNNVHIKYHIGNYVSSTPMKKEPIGNVKYSSIQEVNDITNPSLYVENDKESIQGSNGNYVSEHTEEEKHKRSLTLNKSEMKKNSMKIKEIDHRKCSSNDAQRSYAFLKNNGEISRKKEKYIYRNGVKEHKLEMNQQEQQEQETSKASHGYEDYSIVAGQSNIHTNGTLMKNAEEKELQEKENMNEYTMYCVGCDEFKESVNGYDSIFPAKPFSFQCSLIFDEQTDQNGTSKKTRKGEKKGLLNEMKQNYQGENTECILNTSNVSTATISSKISFMTNRSTGGINHGLGTFTKRIASNGVGEDSSNENQIYSLGILWGIYRWIWTSDGKFICPLNLPLCVSELPKKQIEECELNVEGFNSNDILCVEFQPIYQSLFFHKNKKLVFTFKFDTFYNYRNKNRIWNRNIYDLKAEEDDRDAMSDLSNVAVKNYERRKSIQSTNVPSKKLEKEIVDNTSNGKPSEENQNGDANISKISEHTLKKNSGISTVKTKEKKIGGEINKDKITGRLTNINAVEKSNNTESKEEKHYLTKSQNQINLTRLYYALLKHDCTEVLNIVTNHPGWLQKVGEGEYESLTEYLENAKEEITLEIGNRNNKELDHDKYYTPLLLACKTGCEDCVRSIIEIGGANPNAGCNRIEKETPLMVAANNFSLRIISLLICKYGVNVNEKDSKGNTVLHKTVLKILSVDSENTYGFRTVELLLKLGANIAIKNKQGYSVLDIMQKDMFRCRKLKNLIQLWNKINVSRKRNMQGVKQTYVQPDFICGLLSSCSVIVGFPTQTGKTNGTGFNTAKHSGPKLEQSTPTHQNSVKIHSFVVSGEELVTPLSEEIKNTGELLKLNEKKQALNKEEDLYTTENTNRKNKEETELEDTKDTIHREPKEDFNSIEWNKLSTTDKHEMKRKQEEMMEFIFNPANKNYEYPHFEYDNRNQIRNRINLSVLRNKKFNYEELKYFVREFIANSGVFLYDSTNRDHTDLKDLSIQEQMKKKIIKVTNEEELVKEFKRMADLFQLLYIDSNLKSLLRLDFPKRIEKASDLSDLGFILLEMDSFCSVFQHIKTKWRGTVHDDWKKKLLRSLGVINEFASTRWISNVTHYIKLEEEMKDCASIIQRFFTDDNYFTNYDILLHIMKNTNGKTKNGMHDFIIWNKVLNTLSENFQKIPKMQILVPSGKYQLKGMIPIDQIYSNHSNIQDINARSIHLIRNLLNNGPKKLLENHHSYNVEIARHSKEDQGDQSIRKVSKGEDSFDKSVEKMNSKQLLSVFQNTYEETLEIETEETSQKTKKKTVGIYDEINYERILYEPIGYNMSYDSIQLETTIPYDNSHVESRNPFTIHQELDVGNTMKDLTEGRKDLTKKDIQRTSQSSNRKVTEGNGLSETLIDDIVRSPQGGKAPIVKSVWGSRKRKDVIIEKDKNKNTEKKDLQMNGSSYSSSRLCAIYEIFEKKFDGTIGNGGYKEMKKELSGRYEMVNNEVDIGMYQTKWNQRKVSDTTSRGYILKNLHESPKQKSFEESSYAESSFDESYTAEKNDSYMMCEINVVTKPLEQDLVREECNRLWPASMDSYLLHIIDSAYSFTTPPGEISPLIYYAISVETAKKNIPSKSFHLWKKKGICVDELAEEIHAVHNFINRLIYQSTYKKYKMFPPNFRKYFPVSDEAFKYIMKNKKVMSLKYYKVHVYERNKNLFFKLIHDRISLLKKFNSYLDSSLPITATFFNKPVVELEEQGLRTLDCPLCFFKSNDLDFPWMNDEKDQGSTNRSIEYHRNFPNVDYPNRSYTPFQPELSRTTSKKSISGSSQYMNTKEENHQTSICSYYCGNSFSSDKMVLSIGSSDLPIQLSSYLFVKKIVRQDTAMKLWKESMNILTNLYSEKSLLSIRIDRGIAATAKSMVHTMWYQMTFPMLNADVRKLRVKSKERPFTVVFKGEGATDLGGPFQEFLSSISREVMGVLSDSPDRSLPVFPMCIPSPNYTQAIGGHQDTVIINPKSSPFCTNESEYVGEIEALDQLEFFRQQICAIYNSVQGITKSKLKKSTSFKCRQHSMGITSQRSQEGETQENDQNDMNEKKEQQTMLYRSKKSVTFEKFQEENDSKQEYKEGEPEEKEEEEEDEKVEAEEEEKEEDEKNNSMMNHNIDTELLQLINNASLKARNAFLEKIIRKKEKNDKEKMRNENENILDYLKMSNEKNKKRNKGGDSLEKRMNLKDQEKLIKVMELAMYESLGRIMGVCVCMASALNVCFNPLIWKKVVATPLDIQDLSDYDSVAVEMLRTLKMLHNEKGNNGWNEELQQSLGDMTFMTEDSGGNSIELIKNGENLPINFENLEIFVKLMTKCKMNESSEGIRFLLKGFSSIIPLGRLRMLYDFKTVEHMVCGERQVDLEILKEHTHAEDLEMKKKLFTVLEEFTNEQLQSFLRFVSGRSRLPIGETEWTLTIDVENTHQSPNLTDQRLPTASTCVFKLLLPRYSSVAILRERLLYAIKNCTAIDLDAQVVHDEMGLMY